MSDNDMPRSLRPYQQEAIKCINACDDKIVKVTMFCGTGKTETMIANAIQYDYQFVVNVVPSIALITQNNDDYANRSNFYYTPISICSKDELKESKTKNKSLITTDPIKINKFFRKHRDNSIMMFVTYKSYNLAIETWAANNRYPDVVNYDEAHHVYEQHVHDLIFQPDPIAKKILWSATQKNNDVDIYGRVVFEYTHQQAVRDGFLNDFSIHIDFSTDKDIPSALARSILTTGCSRVMTFHSNVNGESDTTVKNFVDKKKFKRTFKKILHAEFPSLVGKYNIAEIKMKGISSDTKNRKKLLDEFDTTSDDNIYILSSCRTIGEGVDTKMANSCVFVNPKKSTINIIQNVGRVVRKQNKPSIVLISAFVDPEKYDTSLSEEDRDAVIRDGLTDGGDFEMILNVLSSLRETDTEYYDMCLNYPNAFSDNEVQTNLEVQGGVIIDDHVVQREEDLPNGYNCKIHTTNMDEPIRFIDNNADATRDYIEREDGTFKKVDHLPDETVPPSRKKLINVHTTNDVKVLWAVTNDDLVSSSMCKEIVHTIKDNLTFDERWEKNFARLAQFLDTEKRRPNTRSEDDEEQKLGQWLCSQKQNYKKEWNSMITVARRNIWEKFVEKYKDLLLTDDEIWEQNFERLGQFLNDKKKRPSQTSKDVNEKRLGKWLSHQQTNYKNKNQSMTTDARRDIWDEFVEKYKDLLLTDDEIWEQIFESLGQFLNDEKRPSQTSKDVKEKKLGQWLSHQLINYKNKSKSMTTDARRDRWDEFVEKYKDLLSLPDEIWERTLESLCRYMNVEKKRPSESSKDDKEKRLGKWLCSQKNNYKKECASMTTYVRRDIWDEFVEKYKDLLLTFDERWERTLESLCQFLNDEKRKPLEKSNNDKENRLGQWLSNQQQNYKKKSYSMSTDARRDIWEKFVKKYKNLLGTFDDIWKQTFASLGQFFDDEKRRPSQKSEDDEEKKLGQWLSAQLKNYKKECASMTTVARRNIWKKFVVDYDSILNNHKRVKKCPKHNWAFTKEDDDHVHFECKLCQRKTKRLKNLSSTGYKESNPDKKKEINEWLEKCRFIEGKAIYLDAANMNTSNALVKKFEISDLIIPEYEEEIYNMNKKDDVFGESIVHSDFLSELKKKPLECMSLIYGDFTGHFDNYVKPLFVYLTENNTKVRPGTVLGITWSNNGVGDAKVRRKIDRVIWKFVVDNGYDDEDFGDSISDTYGGHMNILFMKKI
jgi:superfamily II DNA or RNA helicase